jgi:hypothetical protein
LRPARRVCDLGTLGCEEQCPEQPYRCNGTVPERCVTNAEAGIEWQATAPRCATEALCEATSDGAACSTPVCGGTLATFRCDPSQPLRIQRCNSARDGWETDRTCAAGTSCDPGPSQQGPAQCDACSPGTYACDEERLVRCEADGQGLTTLETCTDAGHCTASESGGYCLRCDDGQTRCDADQLTTCSEDRRGWVEFQMCEPAFGCHTTADRTDYCNICAAANEARCVGDILEVCDAAQRAVAERLDCELGCEALRNDSDQCRECEPGTAQCSTTAPDERLVCSAAGRWEGQSCGGEGDCFDAGSADYCGSCDPGASSCFSSTERQECTMSGTPGTVQRCPSGTPVCLSSTGLCVQCAPGTSARCTGTAGSGGRETCADNGVWRAEACSGSTPACHEGACKACFPGASRCGGSDPRRRDTCNGSGSWRASNCDAASVCFEGNCVECNPMTSTPRCTSSGSAGREVCEAGAWMTEDCDSNLVCVGGDCLQCDPLNQSGECVPGEGASARRVCDGGQWERADCSDPLPLCQADGRCTCAEGTARCATSGMRQECVGGVWVDQGCVASHCQAGECVECVDDADCSTDFPSCVEGACECELGSERCSDSGAHQVCTGTTWNDAPCMGETPICDADSGACVCEEGAERCQAGTAEICSAGAWQPRTPTAECTPCTSNAQCSGTKPICDGMECVACNDDCPSDGVCDSSGACVECTPENTGACDGGVCSSDNRCVECATDLDCDPAAPICDGDVCRGCEADTECPLGCQPDGSCSACATSLDCSGTTPICVSGECRACQAGDCASGVCNGDSGACEACSVANCPGVCNLGTCVPCSSPGDAGDGGIPCPNGTCVDGICQ